MSGVSLAMAPRSEPDHTATSKAAQNSASGPVQHRKAMSGIMSSLRVVELQLVAFILVFSASGLVPLLDLIFPVFASAYILALSRLAFPARSATYTSSEMFGGGRFFRFYVMMGTSVGLFLPLAYVLGGFARGDDHAVRSATPHLFLLSFQILTENLISSLSMFSPPVRALVPMLYTIRRIFVIIDWMSDVWLNKDLPPYPPLKDNVWFWFGRGLSALNLAYFSINLFAFLIPRLLPRAFERYFMENDESHAKMAEDRKYTEPVKKSPALLEKKAD